MTSGSGVKPAEELPGRADGATRCPRSGRCRRQKGQWHQVESNPGHAGAQPDRDAATRRRRRRPDGGTDHGQSREKNRFRNQGPAGPGAGSPPASARAPPPEGGVRSSQLQPVSSPKVPRASAGAIAEATAGIAARRIRAGASRAAGTGFEDDRDNQYGGWPARRDWRGSRPDTRGSSRPAREGTRPGSSSGTFSSWQTAAWEMPQPSPAPSEMIWPASPRPGPPRRAGSQISWETPPARPRRSVFAGPTEKPAELDPGQTGAKHDRLDRHRNGCGVAVARRDPGHPNERLVKQEGTDCGHGEIGARNPGRDPGLLEPEEGSAEQQVHAVGRQREANQKSAVATTSVSAALNSPRW